MVGSEDHPLEMSPKALNAIGGEPINAEFFIPMTDNAMCILGLVKGVVCGQLIGNDSAAFLNELFDDWYEGRCLRIGDLKSIDP